MIVLGRPEPRRRQDLRHDLGAKCLLDVLLRLLRGNEIVLTDCIDGGGVGTAAIAELAAGVGRVDRMPEDAEQRRITDLGWVIVDLHRLAMPAGDVVVIGRIFRRAADVAGGRVGHPRHVIEIRFHAPEAAAGEDGGPGFGAQLEPQGSLRRKTGLQSRPCCCAWAAPGAVRHRLQDARMGGVEGCSSYRRNSMGEARSGKAGPVAAISPRQGRCARLAAFGEL